MTSVDQAEQSAQASSSHMMKTTKRGRPFLKDTLDLFATLIVSLHLTTHKQYFRTFPNSFTTDEAAANLASLKFSQSNRGPDPRDKSRIVTTTTTTTFSMTRDMAKAMCQHFMDARLIENAADLGSNLFKDRGTYVLTPKGLHVLERFISKNGMTSDHLQPVFASQPICIKLLHLERRSADDEIIVTQSVITALFRRFVGRQPNYPTQLSTNPQDAFQEYHERSKGVPLMDVQERAQPLLGKATVMHKHCFAAVSALEWLCDFTSVVGREEAAEMAAQFVRFGLIILVSDKRKNNDSAIIFTVRGSTPGGNSPVSQHGEFRCTAKAIYRITDEGKRLAQWDEVSTSPFSSTVNLHHVERSSLESESINGTPKTGIEAADAKIHRRISMAEKLNSSHEAAEKKGNVKSNTDRLKYILEEPSYRALFRDFLKANFCEENLAFWMDVEDFKRKFNTTSSAQAAAPTRSGSKATPGQAAMERHHEALIQTAFQIYNKYLAPSSQNELNIDHGLRLDLANYLGEVMVGLHGKSFDGQVDASQAGSFNATQLQVLIKLYTRIQTHVLRLMAMDSLPKFIKTQRFLDARQWLGEGDAPGDDVQFLTSPPAPPGLGSEETGGAYITVSLKGSEREHRHHQRDIPGSPHVS
ncbi:regulator of G protein signaling domain-containing protein [Suillus fuscotomentosus]|uniref:Regulator of G protein signaling domain-containing protein n=1 Tax=Suillus fuscotomentosus TaxID=1912939 RepID=A0AAD4EAV9_9AGAM|nr:regulator of G protein signaling domain-containing protein [Suillus fuscotomentosus]KAG1902905.1 regulator of G protein signaling domain-containing protein [Suillus fuscotomentosus]